MRHGTSLHAPTTRPTRPLRALRRLGATAVAGALLLLVAVAAPAHAATAPGTPVGNLDGVTAASGGVRVRGWAWDRDTSAHLTVTVRVAGTTKTLTANVARADVARVHPAAGPNRGFDAVIPVPAGIHQACVTVTNVGPGANRDFGCRSVTVAGTTTPAAPATARKLTWSPPGLTNPITVSVTNTNRQPRLASGQDYIIKMPSTPLEARGGLVLTGGRNVVLIGGEIKISQASTSGNDLRGLYLKGQTGTVHIEGLKITGAALADGINLDQRNGATVRLQNVRVDTVHGSSTGMHADVLQLWAGPKALEVDGLTGYTTYQGFFLTPLQYGPSPQKVDLRNVNLVGQTGSKYLMWRDGGVGSWPITLQNVWAQTSQIGAPRHQYLRDNPTNPWTAVQAGKPSTGDIVPSGLAGTRYVSPGYR